MANSLYLQKENAPCLVSSTGFRFGALSVQRVCTLPKGAVAVRLETEKGGVTIRVTKAGKMVFTNDKGEEAQFIAPASPKPP